MKNIKTISLTAVLATALIFSGFSLNGAEAQVGPHAKVVKTWESSKPKTHTVAFEICSGNARLIAPEVLIRSDSALNSVKVSKVINSGSCYKSLTQITAADPNTIKAKYISKQKLASDATKLENRIGAIKAEITSLNAQFAELEAKTAIGEAGKKEKRLKINELASDLSELRKELKQVRAEYYRIMYILHS